MKLLYDSIDGYLLLGLDNMKKYIISLIHKFCIRCCYRYLNFNKICLVTRIYENFLANKNYVDGSVISNTMNCNMREEK